MSLYNYYKEKKMKKAKYLIPALLVIAALCFSACDKGPDEWSEFPEELMGKWTTSNKTINIRTYDIAENEITYIYSWDFRQKYQLRYGRGPIEGGPGGDYYQVFLLKVSEGSKKNVEKTKGNQGVTLNFTLNGDKIITDYNEYKDGNKWKTSSAEYKKK
jgi:hypothetical protein